MFSGRVCGLLSKGSVCIGAVQRPTMQTVFVAGLKKKASVVATTTPNPLDGSQKGNRDFPAALQLMRAHAFARFDETVEACFHLNVDPRKANQIVRVITTLPHGTGKVVRVAVFAEGGKAEEAREAGADIVGSHSLADDIVKGNIEFDRCIATPDMMGIVGRVARILGPRQLMPNPKHGTLTMDVKTAIQNAKAGQVNFKVDKTGVLHTHFGKLSFSDEMLSKNFNTLVEAVIGAKPDAIKGLYIKGVALSSTMGPGIHTNVSLLHPSLRRQGS